VRTLLVSGDSPALLREEALAIARRLLCPDHPAGDSCPVCRRVREDSHPDFLRVRPDGPQIKVEDVRDAVRFASGRPYEAPARMIWIDGAEALRDAGANALLKSLEEPGESAQWLLTTTSPESILATIRSRCVHRRLSPRKPSELAAEFEAGGLAPSDARDAVAFGFDPGETVDLDLARESRRRLLGALADGSVSTLLALAAAFAEDDSAPPLFASVLRDAAILASGASSDRLRHVGAASELARIAQLYSPAALREAASEADALEDAFRRSRQKRLFLERLFLRLREGKVEK
jgi:DNA polymerase-3 subunit delta'